MIAESFRVRLEPITPTFVWSGERLVHKADYDVVNGKLVIVDINKAVLKAKKLEEAFREEFAREVQGVKLVFPSSTAPKEVLMVNQYLVPASSLKGLIRTAVLNRLVKGRQDVYNEVRSNLNGLLNPRSGVRPKDVGQPVEGLLKVRVPFGRGTFTYDAFSRLLIGEPRARDVTLSLRRVEIVETVGDFMAEAYAVTLDRGVLEYEAEIVKPKDYGVHESVKAIDGGVSKGNLVESLREFSSLVVNKEKKRVEKARGSSKDALLKDYRQFLDTLRPESSCFPLKVGMFTGHHAKTVDVPPDLEQLREKVMTAVYKHHWDSRTVKLVEWNGKKVGVGWVRVCVS